MQLGKGAILFTLLFAPYLDAQQEAAAPDPARLLLRLREKVLANLAHLPSYLCTETITRSTTQPPPELAKKLPNSMPCADVASVKQSPYWQPRHTEPEHLKVDVALGRDGEMYSPVGENRFPDRNLAGLVNKGATTTGPFGDFLAGIFGDQSAVFTFAGTTAIHGRAVAEFRFHVPVDSGGYSLTNTAGDKSVTATVPYEGSLFVDSNSADLVRLVINATELQEKLQICKLSNTLDYANLAVGGTLFLIPQHAHLHVENTNVTDFDNDSSFTGCREFTTSSSVRFSNELPSPALAPRAVEPDNPSITEPRAELLANVRKTVINTVNRLPRYICTEEVHRTTRVPTHFSERQSCDEIVKMRETHGAKLKLSESDRLRLDVAMSSNGEMFSWVGENHFRDSSLRDLVGAGVVSTGAFGASLSGIFSGNSATFTDRGDVSNNDTRLALFSFRVPQEKSKNEVGNKAFHAVLGYEGDFLVNPETADLMRLNFEMRKLPAPLGACEINTSSDYHHVRLNGSQFLLPSQTHLQIVNQDGSESDNDTAFSSCHEFLGESKFVADTSSSAAAPALAPVANIVQALPGGLQVNLSLESAIRGVSAAAGDPVHARLLSAIKDQHGTLLVAKGALVNGRIVRFAWFDLPYKVLVVAIKWEDIEQAGETLPLHASLQALVTGPFRGNFTGEETLGTFQQMAGLEQAETSHFSFFGVTHDFIIHKGFRLTGTTLPDHHP